MIPIALYLNAGFVSVSVIWFFALCLYNYRDSLKDQLRTCYILLLPVLLFGVTMFWSFFSADLALAFDLVLRKSHLFLIPVGLIIVNKKISDKDLDVILGVFLLACLFCSFVCYFAAIVNVIRFGNLFETTAYGNQSFFTYFKLTEPVNISPVYLSMYANLAFLAVLKSPFIRSSLKTVTALYIGIFIFLLASAVGIVSLLFIFFLWAGTTSYRRISKYVLVALLAVCVVLGFTKPAFITEQFKADYSEYFGDRVTSLPSRLAIWSAAWETIKEKPVTGYGVGAGQVVLEETYRKSNFNWGARESLNPHNQFLSTLLDVGIPGFLILVLIIVYPLIRAIQSKDILATGFIVMTFLFFCMESVLLRQKGIVFFGFFYSVIYSVLLTNEKESATAVRDDTGKDEA